jgi:hypothetical protein
VKFSSALKTSKIQNILIIKILIVNFLKRIFAGFGGALPKKTKAFKAFS